MAMNLTPKAQVEHDLVQALRDIEQIPFSAVNDSESLRHTIKTIQHIARTALMLKNTAPAVEPLFYVRDRSIFQRPVRDGNKTTMGFWVCEVADGVDPLELCAILNKGEQAVT